MRPPFIDMERDEDGNWVVCNNSGSGGWLVYCLPGKYRDYGIAADFYLPRKSPWTYRYVLPHPKGERNPFEEKPLLLWWVPGRFQDSINDEGLSESLYMTWNFGKILDAI